MRCAKQSAMMKDGRTAIIRSLEREDASASIELVKRLYGESENLARYPEEFTMGVREEEEYIAATLASDCEAFIGAFVDGRLVGTAALNHASNLEKLRHRASFAISIIQPCQGLGLGSILLERIIALAQSSPVEQIELEVVSTNANAIALYRKFGFEKTGTIPRGFRLRSGAYLNLDIMVRTLE